jgi:hypothetical protein
METVTMQFPETSSRKGILRDSQTRSLGTAMGMKQTSAVVEGGFGGASKDPLARVAILGNYLPRQCGIATFTRDLASSLLGLQIDLSVHVVAMSDQDGYDYPERVHYEI